MIDLTVNPEHQLIIDKLLCACDHLQYPKDWVYYKLMEKATAEDWSTEISMGTWRYLAKQLGYGTRWATKKYEEIEEQNRKLTSAELDRLWEKALKEVSPYATQALLKQHSRLVRYKGGKACIAVTSTPVMRLVSTKKENIKRALHSVGGFATVVQLEVEGKNE